MTFPEVTFMKHIIRWMQIFHTSGMLFNFITLRIWFLYFQGYVLGMTSKLCCLELAQWFHFTLFDDEDDDDDEWRWWWIGVFLCGEHYASHRTLLDPFVSVESAATIRDT